MNCVLIVFYVALHELYGFEVSDMRDADVKANMGFEGLDLL